MENLLVFCFHSMRVNVVRSFFVSIYLIYVTEDIFQIYWLSCWRKNLAFKDKAVKISWQRKFYLETRWASNCFISLKHLMVDYSFRLLFYKSTSQLTLFAFLLKSQPFHMQRYFCVCRWEIVYKLDTRKYNYI